jgi:hypothetical protein
MSFITRWLSLVPLRKSTALAKRSTKDNERYRDPFEPRSYRAVELRTRGVACAQAKALLGHRMLAAEAPALPLRGCNIRCTCYYKSHADRRRSEPRRLVDAGITSSYYVGPERRSGFDRRQSHYHGQDEDYYDYMRRRD